MYLYIWKILIFLTYFLIFFLAVLGIKPRSLHLTRDALYHLSYTPRPFCLSYFSDRIFVLFAWAGLRPWSSYLCLLRSWDYRPKPLGPIYLLRSDLTNFLPRLALNCDSPDLFLLISWDYRYKPKKRLWDIIILLKLSLSRIPGSSTHIWVFTP
jgi:hypothetical protein